MNTFCTDLTLKTLKIFRQQLAESTRFLSHLRPNTPKQLGTQVK